MSQYLRSKRHMLSRCESSSILLEAKRVTILACFVPVLALAAPVGTVHETRMNGNEVSGMAVWRRPENDGLNSLFLQLRLIGHEIQYAELAKLASRHGGAASLAELSKIAADVGVCAKPVQLTYKQLKESRYPAIVFIEPYGMGSGTFALPLECDLDHVDYIDGASMRWVRASADEFRRAWTGFALGVTDPISQWSSIRRYAVVPLAIYLLLLVITKSVGRATTYGGAQQCTSGLVFTVAIVSIASACGVCEAQQLPTTIRQSLVENARTLDPISIVWVQQLKPTLSPDDTVSRLGIESPPPEILFSRIERAVSVQKGLVYSKTIRANDARVADVSEHSYDGQVLYLGRPEVRLPDGGLQPNLAKMSVARLSREDPDSIWVDSDYLYAAGYVLPSTAKEFKERMAVTSRIVRLLELGGTLVSTGDSTLEGRKITRVEIEAPDEEATFARKIDAKETERKLRAALVPEAQIAKNLAALERLKHLPARKRYVFYLDPSLGYAVVRHEERRMDNELLAMGENLKFRRIERSSLWLPEECRTSYYTWPTAGGALFAEPLISLAVNVKSISLDLQPPEKFSLNYTTPGTLVLDKTADEGSVDYQVPASPADLDEVIRRARGDGILAARGTVQRYWWILIAAGLVMILLAMLIWRRARPKSHPSR